MLRFDVVTPRDLVPARYTGDSSTLCTFPTIAGTDTTFEWNFVRDPAGTVTPRLFRINGFVSSTPNIPQHCILKDTT